MHSVLEILSESTDSAGPGLVSLDDLKLALGIEGTAEDAALQAAIDFQSRILAEYCNRRFGLAEAIETFTFDPGEIMLTRQALVLSLYPVSAIFEVSNAGATAADYHFDAASGRLWLPTNQYIYGSQFYEYWPSSIAVTYAGGFDLPEQAPARLQRAVIETVNAGRQSGTRDPSIREVQHGDTRISYVSPSFSSGSTGQHLTASVTDLIQPYRSLRVA